MNVIEMSQQILLIPDRVFPIFVLPNRAMLPGTSGFIQSVVNRLISRILNE